MIAEPNASSESVHDGRTSIAAKLLRYFHWGLIVIYITAGLVAAGGWILGLYEIVDPEVTAYSLLLSVVIAPTWLLMFLISTHRLAPTAIWFVVLLGTVVFCGGPVLVWYLLIWEPIWSYQLVSPRFTEVYLLSSAGVAVGWLLTLWFAAHRLASMARWAVTLLGTVACWGAPILAWYVLVWEPTWTYRRDSPNVTGFYLSSSVGVTLGWLLAIVFATRRWASLSRCVATLLGTALCWDGLILAGHMFVWKPLSYFERVSPAVTGLYLSLSMAIAVGWLLMLWFATRRLVSRAQWVVVLLGTAVCWGGPLLAGYVFVWDPVYKMRNIDSWNPKTDSEARRIIHRSLVWNAEPHDEFLYLRGSGDESTIPYILWAFLRWHVGPRDGCTWAHGCDAFRTITNDSEGSTGEEWARWYAANKHRTRIEWWADGFTAEGYPVSAAGGEESVRSLLRAWGRTPWCQPDDKRWLSWNARRMLELMGEKDSQHAIGEVLRGGSVQECCGLARYAERMDRADAEAILHELLQNDQRPVRLTASGILSRLQLEWLKDPPGFIEKRLERGTFSDDEFFSPPGASVVTAKAGTDGGYYLEKGEPATRIEVLPAAASGEPDKPACVIRIDWPPKSSDLRSEYLATISIEGILPVTEQTVYSRELIARDYYGDFHWLYDPVGDSVYLSVPDFTCKIDLRTGQTIWEMGYGAGNCANICLLEGYFIINAGGHLVICDAARGGILAYYDHAPTRELFHHERVSLVDGRLRVKAFDGGLCVLKLPETAASDAASSPSAQQGQ